MVPLTVPTGVFWADDIKSLEGDPVERLSLARKYMPLPAAFREAATALRALILSSSRQLEDGGDLLSQLYVTAAQENFLLATPYVANVGPRYDVASSIPRTIWQRLPMPYAAIGYRHLPLLNHTDCDWLVVAWGEPDTHCSAQAYHQSLWDHYVAQFGRTY